MFAQNMDEDDNYASEFTYGITLSTTGGIPSGFILKNARFIKDRWYHVFFLEVMNVKHPKEYRSNNFTQTYGGAFVYDKLNNFYVIRPQYGREYVLFRKAAEQGVQIDAILAGGPSLGFLKPYYIQYVYSNSDVRTERYDPNVHPNANAIAGNGGFWNGLGESKLQIGANLKAGITFEF
ncbi:MAG: hypothetical protein H7Y04_08680, partial [Verrucomicrobia bacterium]|nr:hypothetical protein [Cytophagales bacterium]